MRLKLLRRDISKIGFGAVGFLRLPVGELRLDLGLHRIDIEIAHREDGRARWPIILPIKFDEAFARRRADDVHITYWHALGKQRTCGENLELFDADDSGRRVTKPLLALDDATLLVDRSEEHTSELQSLMRISYAVFCLKQKK